MSCLFEIILMPKYSLQEWYMMLTCWNCYNLVICHFCCIWCVYPMSMSSTCVLNYVMPSLNGCNQCIFVSLVLSASSLLSRVLAITLLLGWIYYFCCYLNLLLQVIICIIWRCSLRIFCYTCHSLSIHAPCCIYILL